MSLEANPNRFQPQLSRSEKLVGIFVGTALLLLTGAFVFYLVHTAEKRGWFVTKAPYFTFVRSATGLEVGEKVKLMGFDVGEITLIEAMPANQPVYDVYVEFNIRSPYYGYMWTDSRVRVVAGDLLGGRYLEVTKGILGAASYEEKDGQIVGMHDGETYQPITPETKPFWLQADESVAINDRLDSLLADVQKALPTVFALTNQISGVLSNVNQLTLNANQMSTHANTTMENLATISSGLTNPDGSLGQWFLPTNINQEVESTIAQAGTTLSSADQNMTLAVSNLSLTLTTVANLTSNLNSQVEVNSNILAEVSSVVVTANDFMTKLRDHWLLRSAFKEKRRR